MFMYLLLISYIQQALYVGSKLSTIMKPIPIKLYFYYFFKPFDDWLFLG